MEELPELNMTDSEADMTTIGDMRIDIEAFQRHQHVLIGLTEAGERSDEI